MSTQDVSPLPDELPPVRPPSAVFVLQLFIIPILIVAPIIGVVALFGRMATSNQDWTALVTELKHPNEQRRWRAAHGLAQLLKADQELGEKGQHLAKNPELAASLAEQLTTEIKRVTYANAEALDAGLNYQAFLTRTLGLFDTPEAVLPALQLAMQIPHEQETPSSADAPEKSPRQQKLEVRKNALASVAVMANRLEAQGRPLKSAELVSVVLDVSHHEDRLLRQVAAYTLGLLRSPEADARLLQLLDDADDLTCINAAVALARKEDPRGFPVLKAVLEPEAPQAASQTGSRQTPEQIAAEKGRRFERLLSLKNALAALDKLSKKLTAKQRAEAVVLVKQLADSSDDTTISHLAEATLEKLKL